MRLIPRNPPGHASRKARRYTREIRSLRAEGHTFETIRLALLDAGVSVSVSTVRREVRRSPTQWELDRATAEQAASAEAPIADASSETAGPPQAIDPTSETPIGTISGDAIETISAISRRRHGAGWLSGLFAVLRRLRRTGPAA